MSQRPSISDCSHPAMARMDPSIITDKHLVTDLRCHPAGHHARRWKVEREPKFEPTRDKHPITSKHRPGRNRSLSRMTIAITGTKIQIGWMRPFGDTTRACPLIASLTFHPRSHTYLIKLERHRGQLDEWLLLNHWMREDVRQRTTDPGRQGKSKHTYLVQT